MSANKVVFTGNVGFYDALKARVEEYFKERHLRQRDNWQMYLKTGIILVWVLSSYVALVFFSTSFWMAIPLVVSLGLAFSAVGFNIQHDGAHKAYSNSPVINWVMAFTMDLVGGSNIFWRRKHNVLHHTYTNINGLDEDIYDGSMFRLSPAQPLRAIHRFQHIYTYGLYGLLTMKWIFFDDWRSLIRVKMGKDKAMRVSPAEMTLLLSTKAFYLFYTVILPLFFHPWWAVLACNVVFHLVLGFTLSIVFQMAHAVGEASFPEPVSGRVENEWAVHQVETTANFAINNAVVNWYTGGLNHQIEHHLFPRISHIHYHSLSGIVEKTCTEFGIPYHKYSTFLQGFRAHYRWLRRAGREEFPQQAA